MTSVALGDGFHPVKRVPLRQRISLGVEIFFAYLSARRSVKRDGLTRTLSELRSSTANPETGLTRAENRYVAYRMGRVVEKVLRAVPDARCLTRSVVLVGLLAKRGLPSSLVIGVARTPEFAAHAWVEYDGIPVLPTLEPKYSRLTEL
jgi:Transglutaminase-like superfamily